MGLRFPQLILIGLALTLAIPAGAQDADGASPVASALSKSADDNCYQKLLSPCQNAANAVSNVSLTDIKNNAGGGGTMLQMGESVQSAGTRGAGNVQQVIDSQCTPKKDQCKTSCSKKKDMIPNCEKDIQGVIDFLSGQKSSYTGMAEQAGKYNATVGGQGPSTTNGSTTTPGSGGASGTTTPGNGSAPTTPGSGGGSGMGSMAQMGMAAAMMGMMMNQQNQQDDSDASKEAAKYEQMMIAQAAANSALQPNGQVICSKPDSGYYSDCDSYLTTACTQAMQSGTYGTSTSCGLFTTRYCAIGSTPAYTMPFYAGMSQTSSSGLTTALTMPSMGASGAGTSTSYCQMMLASNYCAGGAHPGCPSCSNLQNYFSTGCQQNASACMQQTSQAVLTSMRASCPDDPVYKNPAYAANLSSAPAAINLNTTTPPSTSLTTPSSGAATILPQSIGSLQTASVGPTSDIGGEYGTPVTALNAKGVGAFCKQYKIANCQ